MTTSKKNSQSPPGKGAKAASFGAVHVFLGLVVSTIPVLVAWLMISSNPGVELLDYTPQWSDEVYNWHQVATFRAVGFDGGYYTSDERPAPVSFIHFYAHGPVYPIVMGMMGRLLGWEYYSAPILNLVLVTLAAFLFVLMTRPNISQLLLLGGVLATCWPLHLYMLTDMRLAFFTAMAIVLAAFFCRTLEDPERPSKAFLFVFAAVLVLATVSKLTWSFLFFPYFLFIRKRVGMSVPVAWLTSLALVGASFFFYNQVASPYSNVASGLLQEFGRSFSHGVVGLWDHAWVSLEHFFSSDNRYLWLMLRLQMLIATGWAAFLLWRRGDDSRDWRESAIVLATSGCLVGLTILLYDLFAWRDFRLFGPAMLLSTLVFIARKRVFLVSLLIAGNLAVIPDFLAAHEQVFFKDRFSKENLQLEVFSKQISPIVQYDSEKGAWENTILVPQFVAENPLLISVPEGIGISWYHSGARLPRVKSRYAILDLQSYHYLRQRSQLRFVKRTILGDLYLNQTPATGP